MNKSSVEMLLIEKDRVEFMIRRMHEDIPRCAFMSKCSEYRGRIHVLGFLRVLESWEEDELSRAITAREHELALEERRKKLGTENEND